MLDEYLLLDSNLGHKLTVHVIIAWLVGQVAHEVADGLQNAP